jgi:hypothetical protein
MDINRPSSPALTAEQQQALEHVRQRVHDLALHGGLTSDTVRNGVRAMREAAPGVSLLDLM